MWKIIILFIISIEQIYSYSIAHYVLLSLLLFITDLIIITYVFSLLTLLGLKITELISKNYSKDFVFNYKK